MLRIALLGEEGGLQHMVLMTFSVVPAACWRLQTGREHGTHKYTCALVHACLCISASESACPSSAPVCCSASALQMNQGQEERRTYSPLKEWNNGVV